MPLLRCAPTGSRIGVHRRGYRGHLPQGRIGRSVLSVGREREPVRSAWLLDYFVGSAAVTSGGLVFVGNDGGDLYVLDAEVEGMDAEDDDWKKRRTDRSGGNRLLQPGIEHERRRDRTALALHHESQGVHGGRRRLRVLWAFTVEEKID